MLSRIKFRIVGGEYAGKYICNIEIGKSVYFNCYFRPQNIDAIDNSFSLRVENNTTRIEFISNDFLWNNNVLGPADVQMKPGDIITWPTHCIEVHDCPIPKSHDAESTKFLDLSGPIENVHVPPVFQLPKALDPVEKMISNRVHSEEFQFSFFDEEASDLKDPPKVSAEKIESKKILHSQQDIENISPPKFVKKSIELRPMQPVMDFSFQLATYALAFLCLATYGYKRLAKVSEPQLQVFVPVPAQESPVIHPPAQEPIPESSREIASVEPTGKLDFKKEESIAIPLSAEDLEKKRGLIFEAVAANDLEKLAQLTADPSYIYLADESGKNALIYAASLGRLSAVKILLENKADIRAKDPKGNTALMWAVSKHRKNTVEFLLNAGADPREKREDGKDAISLARASSDKVLVALLLRRKL